MASIVPSIVTWLIVIVFWLITNVFKLVILLLQLLASLVAIPICAAYTQLTYVTNSQSVVWMPIQLEQVYVVSYLAMEG